MSHQET